MFLFLQQHSRSDKRSHRNTQPTLPKPWRLLAARSTNGRRRGQQPPAHGGGRTAKPWRCRHSCIPAVPASRRCLPAGAVLSAWARSFSPKPHGLHATQVRRQRCTDPALLLASSRTYPQRAWRLRISPRRIPSEGGSSPSGSLLLAASAADRVAWANHGPNRAAVGAFSVCTKAGSKSVGQKGDWNYFWGTNSAILVLGLMILRTWLLRLFATPVIQPPCTILHSLMLAVQDVVCSVFQYSN